LGLNARKHPPPQAGGEKCLLTFPLIGLPLDRLLSQQSHGPTCLTLWRLGTHHGDDALLLIGVKDLCRAGALFLIQGAFEAGLLVTMPQSPNCLWSQLHRFSDLWRTGMLGQLQERQRPQDDPNLLHSTFDQFPQFLLIFLGDVNPQSWTTHTPSMRRNNST
jgi:hypothetical protein